MAIKVLTPQLVSLIAAGEVISRPASVVKELVENALDAGASRITITTEGGGVSLIRVADDGMGIPADEVELAFDRHATSKIASTDDLESIHSLGFRGEALASVAAAADVEIITATAADAAGTALRLEGGKVVNRSCRGRTPGTTLTVRNLFRHLPARRKFLKSSVTENSRLAAVVSRYALAYPEVGFTLSVEGRVSLRTPGSGSLSAALAQIYGPEVAGQMLDIEMSEGYNAVLRVEGMVSSPQLGRASRDYISLFVNRRWINHRYLAWAVEEAYHGLQMVGRHPIVVISLTVPSDEVDVNVHPAKTEVKFHNEKAVVQTVQRAVRQTLVDLAPVPHLEKVTAAGPLNVAAPPPLWMPTARKEPEAAASCAVETAATPVAALPVLRVIGQLLNTYILTEGPDGMYIVDQHAAHERIRFDQIREQYSRRQVESQMLLEPTTVDLNPLQATALNEHAELLNEFGFTIEPFGEKTFLVRAIPAWLTNEDWLDMIRALLDDGGQADDWVERIIASLACHGAIKAREQLNDEEMRSILRQLERTNLPHCCPHGRPTVICVSRTQLEREFGRT